MHMNHSYFAVDIGTSVWNTAEAPNPLACLGSRWMWRTQPVPLRQREVPDFHVVGRVTTKRRGEAIGGLESL